ncbi:hypothetical protein EYF80_050294 [Liparis tanakae]|uniref:Uncharacterized protein n=1 Tax=Liparis tanakae TaxID=230148 RepID=A0A4Z2FEB8_9TELE|nr:hypothetical protein EYF80_050294 [Liparis tanakae]
MYPQSPKPELTRSYRVKPAGTHDYSAAAPRRPRVCSPSRQPRYFDFFPGILRESSAAAFAEAMGGM